MQSAEDGVEASLTFSFAATAKWARPRAWIMLKVLNGPCSENSQPFPDRRPREKRWLEDIWKKLTSLKTSPTDAHKVAQRKWWGRNVTFCDFYPNQINSKSFNMHRIDSTIHVSLTRHHLCEPFFSAMRWLRTLANAERKHEINNPFS